MKRHLFFDLDGTLADTDSDIRGSWKAAIADLGLDCPRFDELFIAGPPMDEMARVLFPERFSPELVSGIRERFAAHYDGDGFPNTREYPGVVETVAEARRRGAKTWIVTNKRFRGATAMFAHFGWERAFDGFFAGDMYFERGTGPKLRKPELVGRLLREFGATAGESMLIGDTALDFEAARENGIVSVGVTWGYGTAAELRQADRIVNTVAELREALLGDDA